ncbi:MAG: DMT family transporter [Bacteroidetes bacterium]|nr:DMT family transporter [Bacteroidota bacterium]
MSLARITLLSALAMTAFAANSLLCRLALKNTQISPAGFTSIRILSGALILWLIVSMRRGRAGLKGNWSSAAALFVYASAFSFAYVKLPAAVGTLILFGSVQATMIGYGFLKGERMRGLQVAGLCLALGGLVIMVFPGLSTPSPTSALLMMAAGVAWGIYSLRGRGSSDPTADTAGNFMRAAAFAALMGVGMFADHSLDGAGIWYAVASGAVASGIGYAVWYSVLRGLPATNAATIQLSVPVIAAAGALIVLGEEITVRLIAGSIAILGGVFLAISSRKP